MSEQKKPQNGAPAQVTTMPDRCPAEGCGKPQKKMHFCEEHFLWFKAGLINKKGERPSDFDKKYEVYKRKKAA